MRSACSQIIFVTLTLLTCFNAWGQRIEIDRLERDFEGTFRDREAYELSQKFIQIDSTYYTGHYFEGLYRYFRASDELGYRNAIVPLTKAITLMEKDFGRQLRRTTDVRVYINIYQMQRKYCLLIGLLEKCYQYTGRPDKSLVVLRQLARKNFVFNFGVDPYATMSWIYHRNRAYSPERYPFLKETIEENVREASRYADSILVVNRRNYRLVSQWFPDFADNAEGNYWHYKDIVYSYLLKVDSAEFCAKNLDRLDYLSKNNYANLQFIQTKFDRAEQYYAEARDQDGYQVKSTKEFDYMEATINIFKNDLHQARLLVNNSLNSLGPTPGFGWNNIAMARTAYYAGDLESSKRYRDKAANFKELHINSTWGKVQYDRNTLLFQYLYHKQKINEIQFRKKYYWLDLRSLAEIVSHYFKQENAHLLLTSELSSNPERFLVLYNIFATENTIFFDEIWELIKSFNPAYFIDLFEEKKGQDKRPGVLKYYNYYIARFYMEDGDYKRAIEVFQEILEDPNLDPQYEKLLIARVYEGLALSFNEQDMTEQGNNFLLRFYLTYPQLVPYSDLEMKFHLVAEGQEESPIIDHLKSSNITFLSDDQFGWPTLSIASSKADDGSTTVSYSINHLGEEVIQNEIELESFEDENGRLALSLFKINISDEG